MTGDERLPKAIRGLIEDETNLVFVSAVSAMEITTKHRIGKLPEASSLAMNLQEIIEARGFDGLPLSLKQAEHAGRLTFAHKDPFDRLLIAQAILDDLTLVSNEQVFDETGVSRLW